MFRLKRGQGSTEYLVLLAMVLVVAMVAIALLGFFPGIAGDTRAAQSDTYWRGTARPFAIIEHSLTPTSDVDLVLQNLDSNTKYVTTIQLDGMGITATNATVNTYFSAGQSSVIVVDVASGACTEGQPYEFNVTITYNTVGGISSNTQKGTKTLIGTCG